jgi:hypothetical protein
MFSDWRPTSGTRVQSQGNPHCIREQNGTAKYSTLQDFGFSCRLPFHQSRVLTPMIRAGRVSFLSKYLRKSKFMYGRGHMSFPAPPGGLQHCLLTSFYVVGIDSLLSGKVNVGCMVNCTHWLSSCESTACLILAVKRKSCFCRDE